MVAGAPFSGKNAAAVGLIAKSAAKGTVHEEALKIARQIAGNAPTGRCEEIDNSKGLFLDR
jgi:enoyl-CoA hydratase/carnithine racemase